MKYHGQETIDQLRAARARDRRMATTHGRIRIIGWAIAIVAMYAAGAYIGGERAEQIERALDERHAAIERAHQHAAREQNYRIWPPAPGSNCRGADDQPWPCD